MLVKTLTCPFPNQVFKYKPQKTYKTQRGTDLNTQLMNKQAHLKRKQKKNNTLSMLLLYMVHPYSFSPRFFQVVIHMEQDKRVTTVLVNTVVRLHEKER